MFSIAAHLAIDWTKGCASQDRRRLNVEQLGANGSVISAYANDVRYGVIYKEELKTKEQDSPFQYNFIPLSCSGNSENIVTATEYALRYGANVFGIVAFNGGELKKLAQCVWIPTMDYGVGEDIAHLLMHFLTNELRKKMK